MMKFRNNYYEAFQKRIRRHSNANEKADKMFPNEAIKIVSKSKLIRKNWAKCEIQNVFIHEHDSNYFFV